MTNYNLPDQGSVEWHSSPLNPAVADLDKRVGRTERRGLLNDEDIATASELARTAQDKALEALGVADAAKALADGAIRTYYLADPPWPDGSPQPTSNVGDMWFKTVDNLAYRWDGAAWQLIRDPTITDALKAGQDAQITADGKITAYYRQTKPWADADPDHDNDVGDLWYDIDDKNKPYYYDGTFWTEIRDLTIADAQTTADQKITTWYQSTAPWPDSTAGHELDVGDLWFETPTNTARRWDTSNAWVLVQDTGIIEARDSANGKNKIYRQTTQPTTGVLGDTWFNYDDDNRIYVHDGTTWVASQLGENALVDLAVTNAKIADATIQNAKIGSLDVGKLTTGSLTADVTLSGLIKTGDSGARVTIGPDGVVLYATDGSPSIVLPTDPDLSSMFKGDVEADGLTVTGGIALRPPDSNGVGGKHEISKGASLTLQQNITAPQSAPTVIVDYEMTPTQLASDGGGWYGANYGLVLNGVEWNMVADYVVPTIERYDKNGVTVAGSFALTALTDFRAWGGFTRIGTDWFLLSIGQPDYTTYTIHKLNSSFAIVTSTTYVPFAGESGSGGDASKALAPASIGTDGTNVLIGEWDQVNKRFRIQTRSPSTLAVTSTMNTSPQNGFNGPVVGVIRGTFDFGVERTMVTTPTGAIWAFDSSGNYQANDSFLSASSGLKGLAWNPTPAPGNFHTVSAFNIHKYSTIKMTGQSTPQTWYCVTTWHDDDPAGTGRHETDMSPVTTFQMKRRARMSISTTKLPGVGGVDDPNSWLIYLSNTTKDRLSFTGQVNALGGGWVVTLMYANFPGASNPPEFNQFIATGTASRIRSVDDSLVISGDGSIRASSITTNALVGTDDAWITIGGVGAPALMNGFTNTTGYACQIRKDAAGIVWMRGVANVPTTLQVAGGSADIFTLPTGWWPKPPITGLAFIQDANPTAAMPRIVLGSSNGRVTFFQKIGIATQTHIDAQFPIR